MIFRPKGLLGTKEFSFVGFADMIIFKLKRKKKLEAAP
jgi:hypothetical protein